MNNSKFIGRRVEILVSSDSGAGAVVTPSRFSASSIVVIEGVINSTTGDKFIEVSDCIIRNITYETVRKNFLKQIET